MSSLTRRATFPLEDSETGAHREPADRDRFWPAGHKHKPPPKYQSKTYERIPKPRHFIRLLNLFASSPNNPQIECELIMTEFNEKTGLTDKRYEALSWCWGTAKPKSYIIIRKGRKSYAKYVQPDLVAALRALRHHGEDRYLWIDAICINQDNLLEKNHQVEMMSDIYGKADRVCIWLGDGDESSKTALNFIKKEVLQLQNFDDLCKSEQASAKWGALLDLMQRPWFSRRWVVQEIALARKAVLYCGEDKISWSKFAVAVELFVEVETATHRLSEVMKKDPKFYHVPGWFEYVSALGASLLVDATGKLFRDYKADGVLSDDEPEPEPDSDDSDSNKSDSSDEFDSEFDSDSGSASATKSETARADNELEVRNRVNGTITSADSMSVDTKPERAASIDPEVPHTFVRRNRGQPLLTLEYLVSSLSIFEATKEHDIIYALLAIAKDTTPSANDEKTRLVLDHTQHVLEVFTQKKRYKVEYERPFVDVCKDFVKFCLERSLYTDPTRALDVICRPWAPETETLSESRGSSISKKTKDKKKSNEKKLKSKKASTNEQVASDEPKPKEEPQVDEDEDLALPSWIPRLSGASYAMYSHAGMRTSKMGRKNADSLVGLPSLTQRNYNAAETKGIDLKSLKFRKRPRMKHYSLYVKGFVLDTITDVYHSSQGGSIPQEWAKAGGWHKAPKTTPPDKFWRTLVADRGRDGKNPPVYYSRACHESFLKGGYMSGSVNTTDLINNERCSVVAQFCRRVQAVIWNRSLVKTQTGKLGLVGKKVQKGDLVCILYGCSVPVILRKSKEEKSEADIDREIREDIRQWRLEFCTKLMSYQKRVKVFRTKREEEKKSYKIWETERRVEWLRDREWRRVYAQRQYDSAWWKEHEVQWALDHADFDDETKKEKKRKKILDDIDTAWKVWGDCWAHRKIQEAQQVKQVKETGDLKKYKLLEENETSCRIEVEWWLDFQEKMSNRNRERHTLERSHALHELNIEAGKKWKSIRERFFRMEIAKKLLPEDREFNMWKAYRRDFCKSKKLPWAEPIPNWSNFELSLKYGRRWKRFWQLCKAETPSRQPMEALRKDSGIQLKDLETHSPTSGTNGFRLENGHNSEVHPKTNPYIQRSASPDGIQHTQKQINLETPATNGVGRPSISRTVTNFEYLSQQTATPSISRSHTEQVETLASVPPNEVDKENKMILRLKESLKEDDRWHYEFFGECYVHGMMDGEAMAFQNNNGVASTVFELR